MAFLLLGKFNVGLIIDKIGLTHNKFDIIIDKKIPPKDLYIYWLGEHGSGIKEECSKLQIHHLGDKMDIPDLYGKNAFVIKYKDKLYNKMGIYKFHGFSKYHYKIDLKLEGDNLIIDWSISNWYDPKVWQGCDTIR